MPKQPTLPAAHEPPMHTLASMAEALGPPDADFQDALLEGATDAALVSVGRRVASSHIIVDATRLYSVAFDVWEHATDAQRDTLRGFSKELLAIGVARALKLSNMVDAHEARGSAAGAARDARSAAARAAFAAGLTARDQAVKVLRGVAGQDTALTAIINAAVGTAETGPALGKGLKALATAGRKMLAQKKGPLAQRAKLMRVDEAYIASLEAAAARVDDTAAQAAARTSGKAVTQGALDREDGVNALILGHVIGVFEAAHDVDPTIPKLAPIATRRLFGKHRKINKGDDGGEASPQGGAGDADAEDAVEDAAAGGEPEDVTAAGNAGQSAAAKQGADAEKPKAPSAAAPKKGKSKPAKAKAKRAKAPK